MIPHFWRVVKREKEKSLQKAKKGLTNVQKDDIIYEQYGRRTVATMPEWRNWQTPGT